MKWILSIVMICLFVAGARSEDYRIFTDPEGRVIEGQITSLNS